MSEPFHLQFALAQVDNPADEGRRIGGLAVPFNVASPPRQSLDGWVQHRFVRGAFARSIRERGGKVKLLANHDSGSFPVGKAVELAEETDGLHAVFEVAPTTAGDEALELVRGGFVNGLSVGIDPIKFTESGGVITHTETRLREISLTALPAFEETTAAAFSDGSTPLVLLSVAAARLRLRLAEHDIHI